jgi:EAL domain-containing protein (putative c-di-GMP-specific phosphodiesterase class I)
MQHRDRLGIAVIVGFSSLAIACGFFVLFSGQYQQQALFAGLVLLAAAQIAFVFFVQSGFNEIREDFRALLQERRNVEQQQYVNFVQTEAFNAEIGGLKQRTNRLEKELEEKIAANHNEFKSLERHYRDSSADTFPASTFSPDPYQGIQLGGLSSSWAPEKETSYAPPPAYTPPPAYSPPPPSSYSSGLYSAFASEPKKPVDDAPRDHLSFLLEPVVELASNATEHYRARFAMATVNGNEIPYSRLVANAERGGLRAGLDLHVVSQALPLLTKLRHKHPNMKLFIPVGSATLTDEAILDKILDALDEAGNAAYGVVFEISHEALGKLDEDGITGLAKLARKGIAMGLTNVSIAGLDMSSLRHLGVRFIGVEASSVESGFGIASTWQEFVQVARGLQFQIMLTDVVTPAQAASAAQIARLAAGPFFAPPRRVKFNTSAAEAASLSAAA